MEATMSACKSVSSPPTVPVTGLFAGRGGVKSSHSQCNFLAKTNKVKFPRHVTQPSKHRQTRHCAALNVTCRSEKILVANRGEIAVRVIRTAHELGIPCVAVYSTIDKDALHVKLADESVCIGEAPSSQSYLLIHNVLAAATSRKCSMLHPVYGFLAENAVFVEMCKDHGINFIGPEPDSIRVMGDKATARDTMKKANVPTVPGSDGLLQTTEEAIRLAHEIGFPVMIKVEKLKDLCLKQREEIKSLKSAVLFPDVMNSQLQELVEKQGSELKEAKQVIPTLQLQVSSLTGQLQSLAEDLAEVKADKYSAGLQGYCSSPRTPPSHSRGNASNSWEFSSEDMSDDLLLKDLNPCLTPCNAKSKSRESLQNESLSDDDAKVYPELHDFISSYDDKFSKSSDCDQHNTNKRSITTIKACRRSDESKIAWR